MPCICPEIWGNLLREMQAELLFRIMFRYMGEYVDWIDQTREIIAGLRANEPIFQNRTSSPDRYTDAWRCPILYTHTHPRDCNCEDYNLLFLLFRSQTTVSQGIVVTLFCQEPRASCMCAQRARLKLDHREKLIIFFFWFSFHFPLG
jgi:hypothetical protein